MSHDASSRLFSKARLSRQYSGNAQGVIKGIGILTCVYVNPKTEQHWVVDWRIFYPDGDGNANWITSARCLITV